MKKSDERRISAAIQNPRFPLPERGKPTEEEVHKALEVIVANSHLKSLNWCVNYARVGLTLKGRDLRTQCLYILGNMDHWTGPIASGVRKVLKDFVHDRSRWTRIDLDFNPDRY